MQHPLTFTGGLPAALLTTSGHWRAFDVLEVEAEQPQSEGVVVVGDPADGQALAGWRRGQGVAAGERIPTSFLSHCDFNCRE